MIMTMKVVKRVQQVFSEDAQASVLEILSIYGVRDSEPEDELVRLAIIDLCEGDPDKIMDLMRIAKTDHSQILRRAFLRD